MKLPLFGKTFLFISLFLTALFSYGSKSAIAADVHCASVSGNYAECFIDADGALDVNLVQQLSGARCSKGYTFGLSQDTRYMWVSRGCEGMFRPVSRNIEIHCTSAGGNYAECYAGPNPIASVTLTQQLSGAKCRYNSTYGITSSQTSIWVNRGCEGIFLIRTQNSGQPPGPGPSPYVYETNITCGDYAGSYVECPLNSGWIRDVALMSSYNAGRCSYGSTFGYTQDRRRVWAGYGCAGTFRVTYSY